ncbi:hypothetical protein PR202_gb01660 [Eleusine coracana subsp. coracana]|uniref:Uncharacterized protein n=1 Tax=Eleusine coracana subsp. coracana TaxID=191504 RepID=A0AAV5DVP2_ELECO|nr:hypothetical protein PR202_gb01660 [Eleusine coracana subsp. coracana]
MLPAPTHDAPAWCSARPPPCFPTPSVSGSIDPVALTTQRPRPDLPTSHSRAATRRTCSALREAVVLLPYAADL